MRRLAPLLASLAGFALLSSCYVTSQGLRYLSIVASAKPAEELLADPTTDDTTRRLLETALAARVYAIKVIGLKATRNYSSLAQVESEHLVQVVQACKELAFERYLWNFPFVGALPYKGFFDEAQATKEADRVRALGYDAIVRPSDAFSSLGFLADPLFSFMKSYSEYDVAELVIHEMTHATIFLRGKNTGAFNEELATFVGRQGALDFLAQRHGTDSGVYAAALRSRIDSRTFATYLRGTAELLDAVYRSAEPESVKRSEKARIIAARATRYRVLGSQLYPDESSAGWRGYPMERVDNALLDLYRLYEGEPELYERCWREACAADLGIFIRLLKTSKDPAAVIAGYRRP